MVTSPADAPVRCSVWTRTAGLAAAGSAGSPSGYLLVDLDLPWPADVAAAADLAEVAPLASWERLRLQATVPDPGAPRRVARYLPTGERGFRRFEGREVDVDGTGPRALADAASALIAGGGRPVAGGELLVCSHGRRDTCCGSFGTSLFMALQAEAGEPARTDATGHGPVATGPVRGGVGHRRIRRTSHTGGHRYAPTAVLLPEGSAWAWADAALVDAVVTRSGPIGEVIDHYRGCSGLPSPAAQVAEASLLATYGWDLFDADRRAEDLGGGRIRLHVDADGADTEVWEATVGPARTLTLPVCGAPAGEAGKTATELTTTSLERLL